MTGACEVDGCERTGVLRRGMCSKHCKAVAPLVIIQCPDCASAVESRHWDTATKLGAVVVLGLGSGMLLGAWSL